MTTILVTGAGGQLAHCIKKYVPKNKNFEFLFHDSESLDITSKSHVDQIFLEQEINWVINCAAYTNVDKAETDIEVAEKVNITGVQNLAQACKKSNSKLIHISTDFVFNGAHNKAYTEEDQPDPINIYGKTKLHGEREIVSILDAYFILRTSWLYSEFGRNFLNTMLRLAKEKDELQIVDNQIGTPTYAGDLAQFIIGLILTESNSYGLYNYSNEGVASWYDFAKSIFEIGEVKIDVHPIPSDSFPTAARRPVFSVLDNAKIKRVFNMRPPYWRDSLMTCFESKNI
ncbi:dTDP-4-dehydrorhamnose reductase [Gelidibacter mesophilus]|uniref:dTDP-4-dehydrorhamnose reductase n=1 Tax=Gelidibacter mesophilus TaxID=169050 RepID=UPI000421AED5|nr:dTDP-4-dehydrorhamnose reductase [Gelidibacter mesophilus]